MKTATPKPTRYCVTFTQEDREMIRRLRHKVEAERGRMISRADALMVACRAYLGEPEPDQPKPGTQRTTPLGS